MPTLQTQDVFDPQNPSQRDVVASAYNPSAGETGIGLWGLDGQLRLLGKFWTSERPYLEKQGGVWGDGKVRKLLAANNLYSLC